jgi:hypothetical protein
MKKSPNVSVSSSPCYIREADPAYLGFLGWAETIDKLDLLLEAKRAGRKVCHSLKNQATNKVEREKLEKIEHDEAFCCAMLAKHVRRFGGEPTRRTGDFLQKIMALNEWADRLKLLDRGQQWVAKYVREMLPAVGDDDLYEDLQEMLSRHEQNIINVTVSS